MTGKAIAKAAGPASVRLIDAPKDTIVSLGDCGTRCVTHVKRRRDRGSRVTAARSRSARSPCGPARTSRVSALSQDAGASGAEPSPALRQGGGCERRAIPSDPSDSAARVCSVPRNDPRNQAMQPKPRQVEWAVDQAVTDSLYVSRPANWKNLGMPAYEPQGLFPHRALEGGGQIPAQVMLGITAQESNMWQAARFAVPGMTANPLIGNYYGIDYYNKDTGDDWVIRWEKADCGYGVTQVTDGMRRPGQSQDTLPEDQQRAIALDFAANIAKGAQILTDKWNQTRKDGLILNNGDWAHPENWFYAVWAYNSGFYPKVLAGVNNGAYGVGWLNNPINPRYPANRLAFLDTTYADAAHPQDWPYPEKVMGWAGHPPELIETPGTMVHGFRAAWWSSTKDRTNVKPPVNFFCDNTNNCEPGAKYTPNDPEVIGEPAGPCAHKNPVGQYDLKCWAHAAKTWKPCPGACGNEILRFDPGYAYQADAESYPPNCGFSGIPEGALIVDNVRSTVPSVRPNCGRAFSDAGSFRFSFPDVSGNYPGKIDVHQIGTGFGGHFWMSNTHQESQRAATGIWTLDRAVGPWARMFVHLPVVGARTQQARYEIDVDGNGTYRKDRYLPRQIGANGWVSLGVFNFKGVPSVRLSNITEDGRTVDRIAWDAIAVQPLQAKPKHMVAALGDSYSSGEGAGDYYKESDADHGTPQWNACRRSPHAYPRKVVLPGTTEQLGTKIDRFDADVELGFVACSGAKTWNVAGDGRPRSWKEPQKYSTGDGQFHEMSQVESGVLDEHTTLVTLSIGGNDGAAFGTAVTECGLPVPDCSQDATFLPRFKGKLDTALLSTQALINKINQKARNAKIVLLGYPELLSRTIKCNASLWFDMGEVKALAELAGHLRTGQEELARTMRANNIPVYDASPIDHYAGHGGCDDPAWLHITRAGPAGEGDFHVGDDVLTLCFQASGTCLSRESFHPNQAGALNYATVLRDKLVAIGYS